MLHVLMKYTWEYDLTPTHLFCVNHTQLRSIRLEAQFLLSFSMTVITTQQ